MSQGIGNIIYAEFSGIGANGAAIANNGLSVFNGNTIQLGGPSGAAGAAVLLNNREIPMAGFNILYSNVGLGGGLVPGLTFKAAANISIVNPFQLFQDSTGTEIGRINFIGLDTYIGAGAGAGLTIATTRNTAVGNGALALNSTGLRCTAVGDFALGASVVSNSCTAIGSECFRNVDGIQNTGLGYQAGFNTANGIQNTFIGVFAGAGAYLNSSDNTFVGNFAGARTTAAAVAISQAVIIGSLAYSGANTTVGNGLIAIGYNCNVNGQHGANVILIGTGCTTSIGTTVTNSTVIGAAMDVQINNVAVFGRADQNIILGSTVTSVDNGSKLQVLGSYSLPRRTTAVNTTLAAADFMLVLTAGALVITLPTAAAGVNRIYAVINQAAASTFNINYTNFAGAAVNTIAANAAIWLQSDGTNWIRIV